MEDKMMFVWLIMGIAFAILEAMTTQLVSIWFTIGAVCALGAYFLDCNTTVQIVIFVAVSVAVLILTRPLAKKFSSAKIQPTNADMLLNKEAVVTESINNVLAKGTVKVQGIEWTARSEKNTEIPEGEIVVIRDIQGVKLIVSEKEI